MLNLNDIMDEHDFNLEEYNNNLLIIDNYRLNNKVDQSLNSKAFEIALLEQQTHQQLLGKIFYTLIAAVKENAETYLLMKDRALAENREKFTHQNSLFNTAIQTFNNYINYGKPQFIDDLIEEIKSLQVLVEPSPTTNSHGVLLLNEYCRNSKSGFSYHKLFQKHGDLILSLAQKHSNDVSLVVEELSNVHQLPIYNDFGENAISFFKKQSNWTFGSNNPFARKKKTDFNE